MTSYDMNRPLHNSDTNTVAIYWKIILSVVNIQQIEGKWRPRPALYWQIVILKLNRRNYTGDAGDPWMLVRVELHRCFKAKYMNCRHCRAWAWICKHNYEYTKKSFNTRQSGEVTDLKCNWSSIGKTYKKRKKKRRSKASCRLQLKIIIYNMMIIYQGRYPIVII
jgi:hypothetical protein